ncbi:MAG: leucyl/phenylalanyl-tRNA--protein transferase [Planctomycetota bacterium]
MNLSPIFLEPRSAPGFPRPLGYPPEGLVAVGGDLSPERLLLAYEMGIFPWYSQGELPLWWSPDPRALLEPENLHISRSMRRRLEGGGFELSWNRAFPDVIRECACERADGTWIHAEVIDAFVELHGLGHAHSLEVWMEGKLAGGIYGVQRGAMFAAESKFHRRRDMSKVALIACLRTLARAGLRIFDVQHNSSHLKSLGVTDLRRKDFLASLEQALETRPDWKNLEPDWR